MYRTAQYGPSALVQYGPYITVGKVALNLPYNTVGKQLFLDLPATALFKALLEVLDKHARLNEKLVKLGMAAYVDNIQYMAWWQPFCP